MATGTIAVKDIETQSINGGQLAGMRNLIINGDMRIAQRGTGSVTSNLGFAVDRFRTAFNYGNFTFSQDSESPGGFDKSLKIEVGSSVSQGTTQSCVLDYRFEGNTTAHLDMGKSTAKTVTISFYVKTPVAGTYSACLMSGSNAAGNFRSYIFTYTTTSTDWEFHSETIVLDTNASYVSNYPTDLNRSLFLRFDLGSGTNLEGTKGSWVTGSYYRTSDSVKLIENSGYTLYITGVQLEVGSTATAFEHRPFGLELALCQRYAFKYGTAGLYGENAAGSYSSNYLLFGPIDMPFNFRGTPDLQVFGSPQVRNFGSGSSGYTVTLDAPTKQGVLLKFSKTSHGITANSFTHAYFPSSSDYLILSDEL